MYHLKCFWLLPIFCFTIFNQQVCLQKTGRYNNAVARKGFLPPVCIICNLFIKKINACNIVYLFVVSLIKEYMPAVKCNEIVKKTGLKSAYL